VVERRERLVRDVLELRRSTLALSSANKGEAAIRVRERLAHTTMPASQVVTTSPMNTTCIDRRVAVVTGGARGIGLAIARWFLAREHAVALIDIDEATLRRTERELDDAARVLALYADVSQPVAVSSAMRAVDERFGRIDALVNNAGVAVFKPILETSYEEFRHVLATNLDGAFLCTQAAAPVMLRHGRGGAVVNVASISGLRASTLRVAYGTSKGALIHLTKQQAVELGNAGIRVNAVAPGPVDTEMAKLVHTVAIRSDYHDLIPQNRYGTVEEIAQAVGFLCSDAASYVNGQVIAVDGGFDVSGVGLPTLRRHNRSI
jgi:meso-butanediol dehydrogenase / (S,S)-butanediol dehydrogenase / diacetyl reductase